MRQFSFSEVICLLFFESGRQPSGSTADRVFNSSIVAIKEHPDRCLEDHLECDCDSETRGSTKAFVAADMGTVESQEKGDLLLRESGALSPGSEIIREAVICHDKGVLLHHAMKCMKIATASKGGKPAKNGKVE
jgi:hypothetical protein